MNETFVLSVAYLESRHSFWKEKIADAGIWNKNKFGKITIKIGRRSKCFNGMFRRIRNQKIFKTSWEDSITIYPYSEKPDPRKIDDTLVHEMIHQYIAQAGLKDTTAHGPVFRNFMDRINNSFKGELTISISTKRIPETGTGRRLHPLLLLQMAGGYYLCCRLSPTNAPRIIKEVLTSGSALSIVKATLYSSADKYFDSVTACRTRLHGIKLSSSQLPSFIEKYSLVPVKTITT